MFPKVRTGEFEQRLNGPPRLVVIGMWWCGWKGGGWWWWCRNVSWCLLMLMMMMKPMLDHQTFLQQNNSEGASAVRQPRVVTHCSAPDAAYLVGGWTNPNWKICSSHWIISPGRGENKKCLKPPSYISKEKFVASWKLCFFLAGRGALIREGGRLQGLSWEYFHRGGGVWVWHSVMADYKCKQFKYTHLDTFRANQYEQTIEPRQSKGNWKRFHEHQKGGPVTMRR